MVARITIYFNFILFLSYRYSMTISCLSCYFSIWSYHLLLTINFFYKWFFQLSEFKYAIVYQYKTFKLESKNNVRNEKE